MNVFPQLLFGAVWAVVVAVLLVGIGTAIGCTGDGCGALGYILWVLIAGYGGGWLIVSLGVGLDEKR